MKDGRMNGQTEEEMVTYEVSDEAMEAAAGMDVVALREQYGRDILMMGGFDKRILAAGKNEIKQEVRRTKPVVERGGYIPSCDHGVPPDVPFGNFCYFVECLKAVYGME